MCVFQCFSMMIIVDGFRVFYVCFVKIKILQKAKTHKTLK